MNVQKESRADVWSYGGGLQSAAIAVLIAQGKLPKPERIVIADTGKEVQSTWDYLRDHIQPLLDTVGLTVEIAPHSLSKVGLFSLKSGDILMPVYTADGALPVLCSVEWKQRVVRRWLRKEGYGEERPVRMWIGISTNEIGRAKQSDVKWCSNHYPLLFDIPLSRHNCKELVKSAGLPHDIRSACWDCPYRRNEEYALLTPEEREKANLRDEELRAYDIARGGTGVYLHESRKPLREVDTSVPSRELSGLFGEVSGCDSGMCWV